MSLGSKSAHYILYNKPQTSYSSCRLQCYAWSESKGIVVLTDLSLNPEFEFRELKREDL